MWAPAQRICSGRTLSVLIGSALITGVSVIVPARLAQAQPARNTRSDPVTRIGSGVQVVRETVEERRGREALSLVALRWQELLPGWRIVFRPARPGILGMTYRPERRIEIFVRPDRPVRSVARDIAHELGHAVDVSLLTPERRSRFLELRGLGPDTAWWACNACTDLDTGAGDFAETFAWWAAPQVTFYATLAPAPGAEQLDRMALEVFPEAQRARTDAL
jgi:hypothetical protein